MVPQLASTQLPLTAAGTTHAHTRACPHAHPACSPTGPIKAQAKLILAMAQVGWHPDDYAEFAALFPQLISQLCALDAQRAPVYQLWAAKFNTPAH